MDFYTKWLPLLALAGLAIGGAIKIIYQFQRQPGWAPTAAQIKVPFAAWIIGTILAIALAYLAFVITRDPLRALTRLHGQNWGFAGTPRSETRQPVP